MNKNKIIENLATISITIQLLAIFIAGMFYIIISVPFKLSNYENFYRKKSLANDLNISYDNLINYTKNLLEYLRYNLPLDDNWFSKKDIAHMIDVQNLYYTSYNILLIFSSIILMTAIINFFIARKKMLLIINKIFFKVLVIFLIVLGTLSVFIFTNFNTFWIKFHEVLFTNDLWLLSPDESNLIKMFPEEFFFELVTNILLKISIFFGVLILFKIIIQLYCKSVKYKNL